MTNIQSSRSRWSYLSDHLQGAISSSSSSLSPSTMPSFRHTSSPDLTNLSETDRLMMTTSSSPSYDVISNRGFESSNEEEPDTTGNISWIMAAFLLINAALGAGLLNYPVAYDRLGGIGFATAIQIFTVLLMTTTMTVLVFCARLHNESSYHGVVRAMCGRKVMQLAAGSIAITCFGICVTFVIIIGDQFDRIFATYIGIDFCTKWFANRYFTMAVTSIVCIWPMCYFRRLDFLRHVNLLGVIASFYVIFLNIYTYYKVSSVEPHAPPIRTTPTSAMEFIAALPVIFFAYQTHEIVIPVHASMSDRSLHAFSKATGLSMIILLFLYCCAGTFGYMTYGSNVAPDVMLMYDATDPIVVTGIIALVIKMITTYPPVVFAGRDTIVRLISKNRSKMDYQPLDNGTRSSSPINFRFNFSVRSYHICITTIWNIIVLALAIITPNITVAIGFLGSLASCNVFIFPGLAVISLAFRYKKILRSNQDEPSSTSTSSSSSSSNERTSLTSSNVKRSPLSLTRKWVQIGLAIYGVFIIAMGVVMFVFILIQVFDDIQNPIPHGAVCDPSGSPLQTNHSVTTVKPIFA